MPRHFKPRSHDQIRVWNTKEWKRSQSAIVKGQVCQQCGSADVLQVHHRTTDKKLYYTMLKRVVKQLIQEKMHDGEIPFKGKIIHQFHCPHCKQISIITNSRCKKRTCPNCGNQSIADENNLTLQRNYNYILSKSETLLFIRRFEGEIDKIMKEKGAPPKPDYMKLEQDTIVLCKTCHYAMENGYDLCPRCKKKYKKVGESMCFDCLPEEKKKLIA